MRAGLRCKTDVGVGVAEVVIELFIVMEERGGNVVVLPVDIVSEGS